MSSKKQKKQKKESKKQRKKRKTINNRKAVILTHKDHQDKKSGYKIALGNRVYENRHEALGYLKSQKGKDKIGNTYIICLLDKEVHFEKTEIKMQVN